MKKKSMIVLCAAMCSLACLLALYVCFGIYPFGGRSLLSYDMSQQYIEFYSYLSSLFSGENGWGFSFAQSLGGNTVSIIAYYLISPFNILFPLLRNNLPLALFFVTVLKTVSCGLTMAVYLNDRKESYAVVLFSTAYALMSYTVLYASNLMWLDCVLALPLVMLGIRRTIARGKISVLYIASLCYCLVTNFYIGYMVCAMSVLYAGYELFREKRPKALGRIVPFAIGSLLGGGIGAIVLIPAALSLTGTKASFDLSAIFSTEMAYSLKDCLIKWYGGSYTTTEILDGAPNVYCSALVAVCAIAFFFNDKISTRRKLAAGAIAAVLLLSSLSRTLYLLWHGFNVPNCYPGRFSFVISFFAVTLAYEDFCANGEGWGRKESVVCAFYVFLALVLKDEGLIHIKIVLADSVLTLVIFAMSKCPRKRLAYPVMLMCLMLDLGLHHRTVMNCIGAESVQSFQTYFEKTGAAVDWVKAQDASLYRLEKTFVRDGMDYNDSYMFNYAGISSFTSTTKQNVLSFCGKLGYRYNSPKVIYGGGSTSFSDSLLGIKYILSKDERPELTLLEKSGDIYIYENPCALGLGLTVSEEAVLAELTEDTFENQNALFGSLTGMDTPFLEKLTDVVCTYNNMREENGNIVKAENTGADGSVSYTVTADQTGYIYYRLSGSVDAGVSVYVNDSELVEYYAQDEWNLFSRYVQEGETFTVTVLVGSGGCKLEPMAFYFENTAALAAGMELLQSNSIQVEKTGHYTLTATAEGTSDAEYVLFTIPYDSAWSCYVDGEKAEMQEVWGCLMAVQTGAGSHTIELVYTVKGIRAGACVSVICLAAAAVLTWGQKRKKKGQLWEVP